LFTIGRQWNSIEHVDSWWDHVVREQRVQIILEQLFRALHMDGVLFHSGRGQLLLRHRSGKRE